MPKGIAYIQPAQRDDWETPVKFFDERWEEVGGFDMDVACTPDQYTAKRVLHEGGTICVPPEYYDEHQPFDTQWIWKDGLAQPWHGKVWLQPPYGLKLRKWVPKAVCQVECGNVELVMALLPANTDTIWWQAHVLSYVGEDGYGCETYPMKPTEIRFIKGRLQFVGAPDPATFASAIVVWRR